MTDGHCHWLRFVNSTPATVVVAFRVLYVDPKLPSYGNTPTNKGHASHICATARQGDTNVEGNGQVDFALFSTETVTSQ
jgi:hypothetical protein